MRPQDLRAKDTRNLLLSIFSQWLPLAPSAFQAIIDKVPAPAAAQSFRIPRMLHPELGHLDDDIAPANKLERDLYSGSNADEAYRVAYVSKMFAVKIEDLPQNQRKQLTAEDMRARAKALKEAKEKKEALLAEGKAEEDEAVMAAYHAANVEPTEDDKVDESNGGSAGKEDALIGFARLYSGTITLGETLYAVLPKYNSDLAPSHPSNSKHLQTIKVENLFMMMGRELLAVKEVQAGNLFAIGGLEGIVLRNATLCGMGKDRETKEGQQRDEDRDCLVNLAGVTNTVSCASPSPHGLSVPGADFAWLAVSSDCPRRAGATGPVRDVETRRGSPSLESSRSLRRDARPVYGRARHPHSRRAPSRGKPLFPYSDAGRALTRVSPHSAA